jgi:hypothetical protein
METFEYSVIRCVPKVEREEFFNIGVIVFSKRNNFLGVKYKIDKEKLYCLSSELDVEMVERYLRSWSLISEGNPEGGKIAHFDMPYRFRWLTAARSTIIQSSRPHPGRCEDPQQMLDQLFEKYVG